MTVPVPTAFLDRDGVLNVDSGYVHRPDQLIWVPGAAEAVRRLNDAGYRVVVVTNQSGVARGFYQEDAVRRLHGEMQAQLAVHGARIDDFYFCPHHPEGSVARLAVVCDCRKPKPGLLQQAARDRPVDKQRSFMIGDNEDDMAAAEAFGIRGFKFDPERQSLAEFVHTILTGLR